MIYYIWFNILAHIPVVQKKGLVVVYYDLSKPGEKVVLPGFNFVRTMFDSIHCIPVRFSVAHMCIKRGAGSTALNNFFLEIALQTFPQCIRMRYRVHHGSGMEHQYYLQRHGFSDTFPVDASGNIRRGIVNVWFHMHMANEASCAKTLNRIVVQEENDASVASSHDEEMEEAEKSTSNLNKHSLDRRTEGTARAPSARSEPSVDPNRDVFLGRGRNVQVSDAAMRFMLLRQRRIVFSHEE